MELCVRAPNRRATTRSSSLSPRLPARRPAAAIQTKPLRPARPYRQAQSQKLCQKRRLGTRRLPRPRRTQRNRTGRRCSALVQRARELRERERAAQTAQAFGLDAGPQPLTPAPPGARDGLQSAGKGRRSRTPCGTTLP
ncbi:unnamed protein product, partial [Prorocentrum cordatum]